MAARERKFFVGGNWKMNGTTSSIDGIVEFLKTGPLSQDSGGYLDPSLSTFRCGCLYFKISLSWVDRVQSEQDILTCLP